ncbi:hypothetical protein [Streptomyces sp. NPDC001389]|uniref:hypothetical protein n=1 Tax=Streptomyces sp. NPDC001389 TaxID=3364569 RepID=UPI0036A82B0F
MKAVRSLPTVVAACLALAMVSAPPAAAAQENDTLPWTALNTSDGQDTGLGACVDEAHRTRPEAWTCMGGVLRVTADSRGKTTDAVYPVAETTAPSPAARAAAPGRDDYDSWCENGTICSRKINDYTAEVKGNGAYGDSKGVIGSFDIVYRQSFDGNLPRWRTLIDWDSGPEINLGTWRNNCRVNISGGPDDYCGRNDVNLASINATSQRAWWPSGDRWSYNAQRLTGSGKYHDDHEGEFTAFGHRQLFKAGVLHTGRWTKCNTRTGCQYYQVPWKP